MEICKFGPYNFTDETDLASNSTGETSNSGLTIHVGSVMVNPLSLVALRSTQVQGGKNKLQLIKVNLREL